MLAFGAGDPGSNPGRATYHLLLLSHLRLPKRDTKLNLALGSYAGFCGSNSVISLNMNFVIPQSTPVSPTYTFIIVPNYIFP